tara:strand:+ start:236 stop:448 length:213 start_codon:yes stop_codon:yes gene_type:complete
VETIDGVLYAMKGYLITIKDIMYIIGPVQGQTLIQINVGKVFLIQMKILSLIGVTVFLVEDMMVKGYVIH